MNFKNGKLEGIKKEYYNNNGEIHYQETYKKGNKINRKTYDRDGTLEFDKDYPLEE